MKLAPVKKKTWYNQKFPKYNYNWKDFLEKHFYYWTVRVFRKRQTSWSKELKPYLGFMKNVHRSFEQKLKRVMEDTIETYFWLLITDLMKSGGIVNLPLGYGQITIVKFRNNDDTEWRANFMIYQSEKTDKLLIFKKFTNVHIRNIQLYREINQVANEYPERFHTVESFKEKVTNKIDKLQLLAQL